MLPNFLIIGTQRGGTTWLHSCLAEHPQIAVAPMKEVGFFTNKWDHGLSWYESLFDGCGDARAVGEATPEYISHPLAVERMASVVPNAKLIVILRHPIERAYSAYWFFRERGRYEGLNFEAAIEKNPDLLERGLYVNQIERVLKHYSREQLLILLYEKLKADNKAVVRQAFDFLEVDPDYTPSQLDLVYNATIFPRTQNLVYRLHLDWLITLTKKTKADRLIRRIHQARSKGAYPRMKEETRQQLQQYFAEPNNQLRKFIDIGLHWN